MYFSFGYLPEHCRHYTTFESSSSRILFLLDRQCWYQSSSKSSVGEDEPIEMSQWAWQYTGHEKLQVQIPPDASTFWKWSKCIKTANVRKFYLWIVMNSVCWDCFMGFRKCGQLHFLSQKAPFSTSIALIWYVHDCLCIIPSFTKPCSR